MAMKNEYVRRMPGRLISGTTDIDGKRGYVMTLQTREQHIRREKATSNICSNEALCALSAAVYLTALGEQGFREVAAQSYAKSHALYSMLAEDEGLRAPVRRPDFFQEFVLQLPTGAAEFLKAARARGVLGGIPLGAASPSSGSVPFSSRSRKSARRRRSSSIGISSRERGRDDERRPYSKNRSPAAAATAFPSATARSGKIDLPGLRSAPPGLPEMGEQDIVRHYVELAAKNYHVDKGIYPLGSCTMKYNPLVNEEVARLEGFTGLHPAQDEADCQGALELMWRLERALCAITGMEAFTLQPAAGAHGELTGIMIARAYFLDRGEKRSVVLIPDSAHGTNPASVAICGFTPKTIASNERGLIDPASAREGSDGRDRRASCSRCRTRSGSSSARSPRSSASRTRRAPSSTWTART